MVAFARESIWRGMQAHEAPLRTPGLGEPIGVGFFGDRNVKGKA